MVCCYLRWLTKWLLISAYTSFSKCQQLIIFPPGPQIKEINMGTILTCSVEEYPDKAAIDVYWRAPDGDIITSSSGRVHVEHDGALHRLYISEVSTSDAGLYSCESVFDGQLLTADTRLEIYEEITFRDTPTEVEYRTGDSPLLECTAMGTPQPTITWRFNRKPVISDGVHNEYEHQGLRLFNINREDAGFYECRAEVVSQGTLKVRTISLDVQYEPVVTYIPPVTTEVIRGHEAELLCQGIGNPDVTYEWFKEHKASDFAKVKVKLREVSDSFVIKSVAKQDEGRYFCRISNSMGYEEVFTDVLVLESPSIDELPNEKPIENSPLILNCRVQGDPEPVVRWQKIGVDAPYNEGIQPDDSRIVIDNKLKGISKLVINDIQRSDTGQYECVGSNSAGIERKTVNVSVEYTPSITALESSQFGWPGQVINFTCTGDGNPLPHINWLREGQRITDSDIYSINTVKSDSVTSTLQITIPKGQSWIYGSYSCIAKNRYNYVTKTVHLHEATVPDMPRNATVEEETPTSIVLVADLPLNDGRMPIHVWKLQYEPLKDQEGIMLGEITKIYGKDEKLQVSDLTPGAKYTFCLSVANEVGFSDPIIFLVQVPERPLPADPPQNGIEGYDTTSIHRTGSDKKSVEKGYSDKMFEVKSDAADSIAGSSTIGIAVGATVGVGIVVLVIVGLIICLRKRVRKNDYTNTWKSMFSNDKSLMENSGAVVKISESKDIDQIQLEIRRSQPDLICQASPKPNRIDKCRSPLELRKNCASPIQGRAHGPVTPGSNPDSIQQRAWDQMLLSQAMEPEDPANVASEAEKTELTPMMDLPPPPPFLLTNGGGNSPVHTDTISYHNILDGYHSEENIDDDDDQFEICVPQLDQNINHCLHNT